MRSDWEARWGLRIEGYIVGQYDDVDAAIEDMRSDWARRFDIEVYDADGEFMDEGDWIEPDWSDLAIAAENGGDTLVTLAGYSWEIVDLDRY